MNAEHPGGSSRSVAERAVVSAARAPLRASIVIPTWNGAHHLPTCLEALVKQDLRDVEIIVVDNGSSDDTADVLAAFDGVTCLVLPRNVGFARAVNAGIRASTGRVVVLLNNDTEVAQGWLSALLAPLEADASLGMCTSKLRLFDRREHLHTTGDLVTLDGLAANRGFGERDVGQYDDRLDVFGANAAAGAYRRSMLDAIGLFEPAFESYFEDVDLAWRARLAGWGCRFVPEAVVFHHVSATGGGSYASYRVARNRLWTLARNYPTALARRHGASILRTQFRIAIDALRHVRGAAARATLRGQLVGALTAGRWWTARKRIAATRVLDEAALVSLMREAEGRDPVVTQSAEAS